MTNNRNLRMKIAAIAAALSATLAFPAAAVPADLPEPPAIEDRVDRGESEETPELLRSKFGSSAIEIEVPKVLRSKFGSSAIEIEVPKVLRSKFGSSAIERLEIETL